LKEKIRKKGKHPIHLRLLLVVLFLVFGLAPVLIQGRIQLNSFNQSIINNRKSDMQNQSLILSSKLSRLGYLRAKEKDPGVETEMDSVANMFNGRILIVDQDYRIVRDSFNLAVGKYHIAPEVLKCFQGNSINKYNAELNYIVQTTPIYDSVSEEANRQSASGSKDGKTIDGVLLFLSSTENTKSLIGEFSNKMLILDMIIVLVLLLFSIVLSSFLMKPLIELRNKLGKVEQGDMDQDMTQDTYVVTQQISSEISQTIQKLKDMDKSKDEFVSNVSHELKTPITSIRVLADSLMSNEDTPVETYREFMKDISKEVDRESEIIDDLLNLVKTDRSAVVLNRTSVNMQVMLEQIMKRLRPIAKVNNVELMLESVREVTADIDEVKFSMAITNMVENAIKYNVKGGWVKVTLDADHQFCYITIVDSGIGIPNSDQEFVFDRFYRVDKARSRESGGTGLGLSISKNIIMLHKGIIKLTSEPDKGSSFLVRIPLNYIEGAK